ncbi:MAG: hypothetical protein OCC49_01780 [Fibrobacterales bacterium]
MKLFKSTLILLGLTFFVGCLGEETTAPESSESSQQESSMTESVADASSTEEDDSSEAKAEDKKDEDSSDAKKDEDSSTTKDEDSSTTKEDDKESSSEKDDEPDSSSSEKEDVVVSSSSKEETNTTDGIIFEDFETTTGQLVFAKKVGKEGGLTTLTTGGYWFVYADEETPAADDEISTIQDSEGEIIDTVFSSLIEEGALHAFLHASGKIEAEEGRQATIGVNLIGDGTDGMSLDLSGLTEITILAKGTGTLTCGFNTEKPVRTWGTFNGRIDLGDDYEEFTFKTTELIGELYSDVADEPLADFLATVTQFSCDAKAGVAKPKDIEIYIEEITMKGITYADVTINE